MLSFSDSYLYFLFRIASSISPMNFSQGNVEQSNGLVECASKQMENME